MKNKKIPQRRCVGCGQSKDKKDLIRVIKTPEDSVELDVTGRKNGRGAYVCKNPECLKKALKSKALDRSLSIAIPSEVTEALVKEMEGFA